MKLRYELLEKIIAYLYKHGFKSTKMTDLADHLDVTVAILYKEFGNKHEMIEACFYHMMKIYERKTNDICQESESNAEMFLRFKREVLFHIPMSDQRRSWNELRQFFPKIYNLEVQQQTQTLTECFQQLFHQTRKKEMLRTGVDIDLASKACVFSYLEVLNSPIFTEIEKKFDSVVIWYYDLMIRGTLTKEAIIEFNELSEAS